MGNNKLTIWTIIVSVIVFIMAIVITLHISFTSMKALPEGELMKTTHSPDGQYTVNSFLVSGNATVGFSVRCEVIENSSGEKRNIYWQYHCETADIKWVDNVTVIINGKELNVLTDSYDWRR